MMYSEFVVGTGCKDNEHNYKVYKDLEVMYMNSDMTKDEIYEYGRKLVDNSKSEAELKLEASIKEEIAGLKEWLSTARHWANEYKELKALSKAANDTYWVREYGRMERNYREEAGTIRNKIATLKWILES